MKLRKAETGWKYFDQIFEKNCPEDRPDEIYQIKLRKLQEGRRILELAVQVLPQEKILETAKRG